MIKNSMREVQFALTDIQPNCQKQPNLRKTNDLNWIYMNTPHLYLLNVVYEEPLTWDLFLNTETNVMISMLFNFMHS